jgi:HlyD family secretion protein
VAAARARVAAAEAQLATLRKRVADATLRSPVAGVVSSKLIDAGEMVAPGTPLVVVTDLDHAWANVYVDEPLVPQLRLGQTVTLVADDGQEVPAAVTFISPKAEFTPRNVQTTEERSRLVYRIKATADNRQGVLKVGMPVTARF